MLKIEVLRPPVSWEARERLRDKGQFWTPDWIAEPMVEYVLADEGGLLFDPAVGTGAFFRAAKRLARERGIPVRLAGMEIDPQVLSQALEEGLHQEDIAWVHVGDFIFQPPTESFRAIVANPPYIRHHRLEPEKKARFRQLAVQLLGKPLDGRAGLHVYFLVRALSLLEEHGRLAFIMPADTCEGKFAPDLWAWITEKFALEAVVTFAPEATPFPDVDTNPIIFFIRHAAPQPQFFWATCYRSGTPALKSWVRSGFKEVVGSDLVVTVRTLDEGRATGFSRPPYLRQDSRYVLGDFVKVMRGIATGANDFFFMSVAKAKTLGIPETYFVKAVGRTRDVPGDEITAEVIERLERRGRPTLLLSLGAEPIESFPDSVKRYIQEGERLGLPHRPLIAQRKPWYKMEVRVPPPFLFAYLGRRNVRFIRNRANVVPLTSFLCVYPRYEVRVDQLEYLWKLLNHPDTLANLSRIGKSYGDGAIKVEPRFLEKLPVPDHVVEEAGMPLQMRLFEPRESYR